MTAQVKAIFLVIAAMTVLLFAGPSMLKVYADDSSSSSGSSDSSSGSSSSGSSSGSGDSGSSSGSNDGGGSSSKDTGSGSDTGTTTTTPTTGTGTTGTGTIGTDQVEPPPTTGTTGTGTIGTGQEGQGGGTPKCPMKVSNDGCGGNGGCHMMKGALCSWNWHEQCKKHPEWCRPIIIKKEVHESHSSGSPRIIVQQPLQPYIGGNSDVNLLLVTTCTADVNSGTVNPQTQALCDSTITMMHNDGLNAQLPQVDLYLKARGLMT